MKFLRNHIIRFLFIIVTGLTFLNMSFILAELAALKNSSNKIAIENLSRLFLTSFAEEETDAAETENVGSDKEIDFLSGQMFDIQFEKTGIESIVKKFSREHSPQDGYLEIITPPPDKAYIG